MTRRANDEELSTEPSDLGFRQAIDGRLDKALAGGGLDDLHSLLVVHQGRLVFERYFAGEDKRWGQSLGRIDFGPDDLHDLRSVTKSVVGLLYGIALGESAVPPPDAVLVDCFPDYADLRADPDRRRMTLGHALSMKLGLRWDEELPYSDARNSEIAMELAADRCRFVLEQPFVAEPGDWWIYNGGATALIARILESGTGRSLRDFAETRLFDPLGITAVDWIVGRDGVHSAASGLRLRPRDLAKIGRLVLQGGRWEGRSVVPEDWLSASFEWRSQLHNGNGYGYFWWLGKLANGSVWQAAIGNGGQRLFLLPSDALIVIVTAGAYDQPDAWQIPARLLDDIVLPAHVNRPAPDGG
ncbi:MAG: serine hydrolase [Rhodospirillales bacterium]